MLVDHYTLLTSSFRNVLLATLEPIEKTAMIPRDIYNWVSQDFTSISRLRVEKNRLETENLLLKVQLQQLNNLEVEVAQLNRLLGTASQQSHQTSTIASVIGYSSHHSSHFIILNRGSNAGLDINLPVLDSQGVMGKIINLTPFSSRVLLITDPESQVPVRIQRTGQRGILTGTGREVLSLQFIPNSSSVIIGDIIETSGLGKLYPEGHPIATVLSVKNRKDLPYYEINTGSIAKLNTSRKVLVIRKTELLPSIYISKNHDE